AFVLFHGARHEPVELGQARQRDRGIERLRRAREAARLGEQDDRRRALGRLDVVATDGGFFRVGHAVSLWALRRARQRPAALRAGKWYSPAELELDEVHAE